MTTGPIQADEVSGDYGAWECGSSALREELARRPGDVLFLTGTEADAAALRGFGALAVVRPEGRGWQAEDFPLLRGREVVLVVEEDPGWSLDWWGRERGTLEWQRASVRVWEGGDGAQSPAWAGLLQRLRAQKGPAETREDRCGSPTPLADPDEGLPGDPRTGPAREAHGSADVGSQGGVSGRVLASGGRQPPVSPAAGPARPRNRGLTPPARQDPETSPCEADGVVARPAPIGESGPDMPDDWVPPAAHAKGPARRA
jgi:hypothetical protein